MAEAHTFSDEELTAYLDGEAGSDLAQAIDQALETDPALTARMEELTFPKDALAAAFDAQLALAPSVPNLPEFPAETATTPLQKPSGRGFWPGLGLGLGGGLAAGLAVAMFTGLGKPAPAQPGWIEMVANYQVLYVPETLQSRRGPPQRDGQAGAQGGVYVASLEELSSVVGLDLTGLKTVDGLQFKRAQRLGFNGKPLIQVAYTLPDGTPFAICILPSDAEERAPRTGTVAGLAATDWTTGTHGIVIIGGQDEAIVETLSQTVQPLI